MDPDGVVFLMLLITIAFVLGFSFGASFFAKKLDDYDRERAWDDGKTVF